jgi:hypothetical protein
VNVLHVLAFVLLAGTVIGWFVALASALLGVPSLMAWRAELENGGFLSMRRPVWVGPRRMAVELSILVSLFRRLTDYPGESDRIRAAHLYRRAGLAILFAVTSLGISILLFATTR